MQNDSTHIDYAVRIVCDFGCSVYVIVTARLLGHLQTLQEVTAPGLEIILHISLHKTKIYGFYTLLLMQCVN